MKYSLETLNDLHDFFQGAPIALAIADPEGRIRRTNRATLEMLRCADAPERVLGRPFTDFLTGAGERALLGRLQDGEALAEEDATCIRSDGSRQRVLVYVQARRDAEGALAGLHVFAVPHPEDLDPALSLVGALREFTLADEHAEAEEDLLGLFEDLSAFFEQAPASLHMVTADGRIKHSNPIELAALGYEGAPEEYLGHHIAEFHADQQVIDGMLHDLVDGSPLTNFHATLFKRDKTRLPVMIYSNSRMRNGSFVNTRCFTFPVPAASRRDGRPVPAFTWPRDPEAGFRIPGREEDGRPQPDPMTLALKYIASRKGPEESLGFLAELGKALDTVRRCEDTLADACRLCVPFLADYCSWTLTDGGPLAAFAEGPLAREGQRVEAWIRGRAKADGVVVAGGAREGGGAAGRSADNGGTAEPPILSAVLVPLVVAGEPIGTASFLRHDKAGRRPFAEPDVALAEEVARRVSQAVALATAREELSRA